MKMKWKQKHQAGKRLIAFLLSVVMVITLVPSFQVKTAFAAVTEIELHQTKIGHSIKENWTMHDTPGNQSRTKKSGSHMWRFRIGGKNAYCLDFAKHSFESGDPTYGDKSYFLQEWSDYNSTWGSTWTGNAPSGAVDCSSKTKAMIAAAMFSEKNPSGCTLDSTQRRMFAQMAIWAIRCQANWKSTDKISDHKASVITQLNNAMTKVDGISTKYSADNIYDYIFKTNWSSYKVRIKFFKSCKYDSKGNVVEVSGYQRFMNIKIVPDEDFDWETVGASEGYHQRVRVYKTDELGRALGGVKFRLTLTSDTENVYDYRVSLADGSMASTDDVNGSYGMDENGNDYLIATTDSSGYAYFFIARNNSVDDAYGYITSPSDPSDKIKALARAEMADCEVAYYSSKAAARTAAEKALAGARAEIHDEAMITEEASSLPDAYSTIAKSYTVYNRRVGGNGAVTSTYSDKDEDMANTGVKVRWDQDNVYFKDSKGVWLDEQATSTGLGTMTHGRRNDVSQVDVVDKIKKIQVRVTKRANNTKDGRAYGAAILDGAEYQLYSDAACTKKATVYGEDKKEKTAGVYTTAKGGVLLTDYLLCGVTYYIKEVKAPTGFLLSNEVQPITVSGAEIDDSVEFSNSPSKEYVQVNEAIKKNDINIYKILGGKTGQTVFEHNVKFQIYLVDENGNGSYENADPDHCRAEIVTDKYGRGTAKDLVYGTYMVHQVDTGLYDTEKVEDFPVDLFEDKTERDGGYDTVLINEKFKAYLKIRKTDANTGKTVLKPDTVFEIFRVDPDTGEETQVIQTGSNGKKMITLKQFTTDEEGTVETLHELESGTYRIREVESAPGLHQVKDYIEVEINSKNDNYKVETDPESKFPTITVTVDYENEETHGQLSIAKKGEQLKGYDPEKKQFTYEEAYLKGVTFEVYAKEDIATQDNQGTNWYDKGELVATIHTGEDVQFSKECEGITGYEMDEDGVITLDLPLGEYTIQEKNTLYGYVLPDKDWDVSFTWENKEASYVFDSSDSTNEEGRLEILNLLAKARVSIQKEDNATYKPVQGAVFGLYTADDIFNADGELIVTKDTLLDTVTTDGEGKAASAMDLPLMSENYGKKIDPGSETDPENPDAGDQKPGQDEDQEQKKEQNENRDQDKKGIRKSGLGQKKEQGTDQQDQAGSQDQTENEDQTDPGEETDPENPDDPGDLPEDGQIKLNSGNYYWKELSISNSYYLDGIPLAVHAEYLDQNTTLITEHVVKGNDQTQVEIDKLTLAGSKELPGCKLVVSDINGNVIIGWTSGDAASIRLTSQADALGYRNLTASLTEKGNLTISGLLQDTEYVLTETKPADGYVTASDITFKLGAGENNQIYIKNGGTFVKGNTGNRVMMYDDTTKIRFKKIASDTKKQLAGAEFEVYDSKGNQVYSFTTGKKAEKIVGVLAAGKTYTFKEVTAPKGYKKAKAVKWKVADSGEFQIVKVKDQAYGKITTRTPNSGPEPSSSLSPKTGYTILTVCLTVMMFSSAAAVILLRRKRRRSA